MGRIIGFVYGVVCYLVFLGSVLYAIGFLANVWVPKSIDSGAGSPLGKALAVNCLLLGLFALQHSTMARPAFKRLWTRLVPRPLERSTFVLFASLLLLLLFWQWRPMTGTLWDLRGSAAGTSLSALFLLGWLVVLLATGMVDHWDLFGLRQVWDHLKGRGCTHPPFQTRGFYRYLRHPIMLGFLIAFWATPHLTSGHLLFALATSSSIFLGIALEERDLLAQLGPAYREYRRQVSMIVPWRARSGSGPPDGSRD